MIIRIEDISPDSDIKLAREFFEVKETIDTPSEWKSNIPDVETLLTARLADPAIAQNHGEFASEIEGAGSKFDSIMQVIGKIAMGDFVRGQKVSLGCIATSAGWLAKDVTAISRIMRSSQTSVESGFNVVDQVLDSRLFEMALDALGAVPFVGWVIRTIFNVAKTFASIIEQSRKLEDQAAKRSVAERLTIPYGATHFNEQVNEWVTQQFFDHVKNSPQALILPAFNPNNSGRFGMFDGTGVCRNAGDDLATGWMVYGAGRESWGYGYVPGTSNITRSIFFAAGAAHKANQWYCSVGAHSSSFRDMGSLYTTPSNLCSSLWSQVSRPSPAMFMFDPLAAKSPWETYMESMYGLCMDLVKGWSCAPSGYMFTDEFECHSSLYVERDRDGMGGCRGTRPNRRGDRLKIPGDFGITPNRQFYEYLAKLFFGINDLYNNAHGGIHRLPLFSGASFNNPGSYYEDFLNKKFFRPDAIDYSKSTPVKALEALYNGQKATLDSRMCMYVNGEDPDRFPAFRDSNLKSLWQQSVTTVLNTEDWRRVNAVDIPEGPAKQAFRQRALGAGIQDPDKYRYNPNEMLAMPSVLGDPQPPEMPPMTGTDIDISEFGVTASNLPKRRSKKKSSNLPLILAAGAIGFLFLNNKK